MMNLHIKCVITCPCPPVLRWRLFTKGPIQHKDAKIWAPKAPLRH